MGIFIEVTKQKSEYWDKNGLTMGLAIILYKKRNYESIILLMILVYVKIPSCES